MISSRFRCGRCSSQWLMLAEMCALLVAVLMLNLPASAATPTTNHAAAPGREFLTRNCLDCHQGAEAEAGLDLARLGQDLGNADAEKQWVRIFDRVNRGEMPPADAGELPAAEKSEFLKSSGEWIRTFQHARDEQLGRVRARRL